MERVQLEVSSRETTGKGAARKLRALGKVPAIVYGRGSEPIRLELEARSLERVLQLGANQLIDLKGDKKVKGKLVLIKEGQRDPLSRRLLHCDFYEVDTTKKVQVSVPIRLEGRPHGVEMGGVLEPLLRHVDVSCLPLEIPASVSLDISGLDINQGLRVSDLQFPATVECLIDPTAPVVHVVAPRVEEEPEPEEAVEAVPVEGEAPPEPQEGEGG